MPSVLHLLKADSASHALAVIERQSREPGAALIVVLMRGMPTPTLPSGVTMYQLGENSAEGTLTYSELLDLIFSADQVISW
ncbi:MAG TPA: hypothetical protein VJO34_06775 [Methylomirabilota bacterium]|nr:hypothetical protein [Methylomirabilota bacterium]